VTKQTRTYLMIALGAILAVTLTSAWAQTGKLSPGDQKIAQALFEAQGKGTATSPPLTLDQIASMKTRDGWGQVFKDMKSKGLLTQKTLGQVVSDFEKRHPEMAKADKTAKAEKPDKPEKVEKPEKPAKPEKPGR
jgi:hypothetical protein